MLFRKIRSLEHYNKGHPKGKSQKWGPEKVTLYEKVLRGNNRITSSVAKPEEVNNKNTEDEI